MKNLQSIIIQKPVYLNDWRDRQLQGLMNDFEVNHVEGNILFASYGQENYNGQAFVLLEKAGKLYEINADTSSWYGLEGQFEPEETTLEALAYRLTHGTMGEDNYTSNIFADELKQFLGIE